jgi:GrpB-like predicted nucleotidyltransferase (UPF0157 family)/nicotinamidase-related amidase
MKALVLIDIQNGLTKKNCLFNEKLFFDTINSAIEAFRNSGWKILFIQHNNKQLKSGSFDWEIDNRIDILENDIIIQKKYTNAFQKSQLKSILIDLKVQSITIGGLVSHGCLKATCLGGLTNGFDIAILKNGHTNWHKDAEWKISETEKELSKNGAKIFDIEKSLVSHYSEKSVQNFSINELGELFPITIHEYSNNWMNLYRKESKLIIDSFFPSEIIKIDHIGSTAIPGLKAKPTIDILLQVSNQINLQKVKSVFKSLDYQINEHPDNPPPHLLFVKGYTMKRLKEQTYHVHIRYKGNWDEVHFRDYLLSHEDTAKEYEALKLKLVKKFRNDREAYTNSKTEFIERIVKLARGAV